jgi:hypothetical protein
LSDPAIGGRSVHFANTYLFGKVYTLIYMPAGQNWFHEWLTSQWPSGARDDLTRTLGLGEERLPVIAPDVGDGRGVSQLPWRLSGSLPPTLKQSRESRIWDEGNKLEFN